MNALTFLFFVENKLNGIFTKKKKEFQTIKFVNY